jgi:hypothetical protein
MPEGEPKVAELVFRNISEGQFVDPLILYGQHRISAFGTASGPVTLSGEAILRRHIRSSLPAWAADLSVTGLLRIQAALKKRGYTLQARLDDRTFLAANGGDGSRPLRILEFSEPGFDLASLDLDQFEAAVTQAPTHNQGGNTISIIKGSFPIREALISLNDLPLSVLEYTPGLFLVETVRLIYAFEKLELGSPFAALTLMPGESRTVRSTQTTKLVLKDTHKTTFTESRQSEVTEDFKKSFKDTWEQKSSDKDAKGVKWTSANKLDFGDGLNLSSEFTTSQENVLTLELLSNSVLEALNQTTAKWTTKEEIIEVRESYIERTAETEQERKFELKNSFQDRALTFVTHHILHAYVAHLDLINLELIHFSEDGTTSPKRIPLSGPGLRDGLESVPGLGNLDEAVGRITRTVGDRYEKLGIGDGTPDGFELKKTPSDYVNLDLYNRSTMLSLDKRQRIGPLPTCLVARRIVVRSGSAFVRTYADVQSKENGSAVEP